MNLLLRLSAIGLGGALGAITRFSVVSLSVKLWGERFPYGTLMVNVVGSFLIGIFFSIIFDKVIASEFWRLLVVVGFLGAFTTFSSFSLETMSLIQNQQLVAALMNIFGNLTLCLVMVYLGISLGRFIE